MLFSIITISFRNLAGLGATAASLPPPSPLAEWIVIDGGSQDGTPEWLSSRFRTDLRWISEPDQGIFDAMNKGITRAKGEYLLFLNAGDRLAAPDVLQRIADDLGAARPGLIYGNSYELAQNGTRFKKTARHPRWNHYSLFTHHQALLYRRDIVDQGYDLSYRLSADWALTSKILARPGLHHHRFHGEICDFERGGVSQSQTHRRRINNEHWRILRKEMGHSWPIAQALYQTKLTANRLRQLAPAAYDLVRFGQARPASSNAPGGQKIL